MTDKPNDDDDKLGDKLNRMAELYDEVMDSPVTQHAVDFLARAQLLLKIADTDAAKGALHTPGGREAAAREYNELADDDRAELLKEIGNHWTLNVNLAVRKLWHAAEVLGFQPDTLDPKHVAMVAATYLSRDPKDVHDELAEAVATDS